MDVFSWSLPFVSEKAIEVLFNVLMKGFKTYGMDMTDLDTDPPVVDQLDKKKSLKLNSIVKQNTGVFKPDVVKQKLSFIGKIMRMQTNLRQNRELFIQLRGMCPDNKIPKGLLLASTLEIKDALEHFKKAKELDSINEQRPN